MGVLIVVGVVVLAVAITQRLGGGPVSVLAATTLDEPAGTRIAAISSTPDRLTLLLQGGGGTDRVVSIEARTGRVLGRVTLPR